MKENTDQPIQVNIEKEIADHFGARDVDIYKRREAGESFASIGRHYGISKTRVAEIYKTIGRIVATGFPWYRKLPPRMWLGLRDLGLWEMDQAIEAYKKGELSGRNAPRYWGEKSEALFCKVVGLPPIKKKLRVKPCPHCGKNIYEK